MKSKNTIFIFPLLLTGFLLRLLVFLKIDYSFGFDVGTFQFWARALAAEGFSGFYSNDYLTDYPPAYLYVLRIIGIFGESRWFNFLTFLPAMLADLGIGYALYRMASKRFSQKAALFTAAAWIFNPAIILISSVWGQVEAVYLLILLVSLGFLREKKLLPAYVLYGLAILTKPQSLFVAPVYLYSAYEYLDIDFNWKKAARLAAYIGAAALGMVLVALPFGLMTTISEMRNGMAMYNHSTVNAFNFWAIFGNFQSLDTRLLGVKHAVWGMAIVGAIVWASMVALHTNRTRHNGRYFYLIVAALFIVIFTFSIKMHERYLFPGLLFILAYYADNRDRREFILYCSLSAVFFINCLEILRWANIDGFELDKCSIQVIPYVTVVLGLATIGLVMRSLFFNMKKKRPKRKQNLELEPKPKDTLKNPPPMRKRDYALLGLLIAVYSVLAFVRLGDTQAPQTTWLADEGTEAVFFDLGESTQISKVQYLLGADTNNWNRLELYYAADSGEYESFYEMEGKYPFEWQFEDVDVRAQNIKLVASVNTRIQEIAFRGEGGEVLPIVSTTASPRDGAAMPIASTASKLTDEQHLLPEMRTFMNSVYFDEVFYPRTGYELLHGLEPNEKTHPPLGKLFIAASIRLFGMTPFAWRLPGTLFGIFMLPLLYALARKLLKSNNFAFFATFIFTFDFMLFSQTRMTTIDSYVTFFILAMYFLMYCYISGLEKNSFGRSILILTLCGTAMGLAIASKWQGIYGAFGLPVLFFPALYKLYLRDKKPAIKTLALCFVIFVAMPLAIYVLSYIPYIRAVDGNFLTIWENQKFMLTFHSHDVVSSTHPFSSPWWAWPLIITPLFQYHATIADGIKQGMSSIGSPAVWWFGIFVTGYTIYSLRKKQRHEADIFFVLIAYAANFVPWVFIERTTFIYHYFPSVPFVVLLIAMFFKNHVKHEYVYYVYAGIVLVLFIIFFPVLSGMSVSVNYIESLKWLPEWVLA